MKDTPEYLEEFARSSGIDTSSWRTWYTEAMLSVSGIRERAQVPDRKRLRLNSSH